MGNSIFKRHQLDIIIGTKLDERQMFEAKKSIKNFVSEWESEIENAKVDNALSKGLTEALQEINNKLLGFKLEPIKIEQIQGFEKPFEKLGELAIQKFIDGFKVNGDALSAVTETVGKIYDQLDNRAQKSADNVIKSISQIEAAAKRVKKNGGFKEIEKAVKHKPIISKDDKEAKRQLVYYANQSKNMSQNKTATWEQRYTADVQFVDYYERYIKKIGKNKQLSDIFGEDAATQLTRRYERLAESYSDKSNMLQNIVALKKPNEPKPFVGYDRGEPWAREDTLREIKGVLEKGVVIKDDNTNIKQQTNETRDNTSRSKQKKIKDQLEYTGFRAVEEGSNKNKALKTYGAEYFAATSKNDEIKNQFDIAKGYAEDFFKNGSIIEAKIKPVNPLIFDAEGRSWSDFKNIPGIKELFPEIIEKLKLPDFYEEDAQKYINEQASKFGFDSVIFENVEDTINGAELDKLTTTIAVLDDNIVSLTGAYKVEATKEGNVISNNKSSEIPSFYHPPENSDIKDRINNLQQRKLLYQQWHQQTTERLGDSKENKSIVDWLNKQYEKNIVSFDNEISKLQQLISVETPKDELKTIKDKKSSDNKMSSNGEPWAKETTLQKIEGILKQGINVKGTTDDNPIIENGKLQNDTKIFKSEQVDFAEQEASAQKRITEEQEKQNKVLLLRRGLISDLDNAENFMNQDMLGNLIWFNNEYKENQDNTGSIPIEFNNFTDDFGTWGDGLWSSVANAAEDIDFKLKENQSFFEIPIDELDMLTLDTEEYAKKVDTFGAKLQRFILAGGDFRGFDDGLNKANVNEDTLFNDASQIFDRFAMSKEEFVNWINDMKNLVKTLGLDKRGVFTNMDDKSKKSHNFATRFLQTMGYDGVLANIIDDEEEGYNGNYKGSVIFDPDFKSIKSHITANNRNFKTNKEYEDYLAKNMEANQKAIDDYAKKSKSKDMEFAQHKNSSNIGSNIQMNEAVGLKIAEVTNAVNEKTEAFTKEKGEISKIVASEVNSLTLLEEKVLSIKRTIEMMLNDMNTKTNVIHIPEINTEVFAQEGQVTDGVITKELDSLQKLRASLQLTTKRINTKTQAFETEGQIVTKVINSEINVLNRLQTVLNPISTQLIDIVKNLQVVNTSRNNILPINQPNNIKGGSNRANYKGVGNALFDAKIETQFSSLSLLYSKLESTGKLTDEVKQEWMDLWDSLDKVKNTNGLQLWQQQLLQTKNHIEEIAIANKQVVTENKNSFDQLIAVSKLYSKMSINAEKSTIPEVKAVYEQEANSALVEQQILLKNITLTKEQQAKYDDIEIERKKQLSLILAQQNGREKQIHDAQVEAEIVKQLIKLYEQLGRAQAAKNKTEASRLGGLIGAERGKLTSIDYATNVKFRDARKKGYDTEQTKAENAVFKERRDIIAELIKMSKELGELTAKSQLTTGDNLRSQFLNELLALQEKFDDKKNKLANSLSQEEQGEIDDSFMRGISRAANEGYRSLAKRDDRDEITRLKNIEKLEKEIGKLRAESNNTTNSNVIKALEQEIQYRKDLIDLQKQGKSLSAEDEAFWKNKYSNDTQNAKKEERNQTKKFEDTIKQSQSDAGRAKGQSAVKTAQGVFDNAAMIEGMDVQYLKNYKNQIDILKNTLSSIPQDRLVSEKEKAQLKEQISNLNIYTTEVKDLIANYEKLSGPNVEVMGVNALGENATVTDQKKQLSDMVMAYTKGRATIKSYDATTNELKYTIKSASGEFTTYTATLRQADGALVSVRGQTTKTMGVMESVVKKVREFSYYLTGSMMVMRVVGWMREGVSAVKEIDSALTELKKVTDETEETYDSFLNTAAKTADKVGSTIKDVVSSTADFARLGYSLEDAAKMAENAQLLMNVSEFTDISSTTDTLISAVQAFSYTADETSHVVDILNKIGNNYAISTADLASSLTRSSSALVAAGGTLEEAVALTAAANTIIQDADSVGNALKVVSMRIRGTSTKELEAAGEETDGLVESTSKLYSKVKALTAVGGKEGISILGDDGKYLSTYEILTQIAERWDEITQVGNDSALLELLAGKTRGSVVAALLQQPDVLKDAYQDAMDAEGSALAENEKYLDSIQGRIDLFTNSVQTMWKNTLDSDVIKGFVNLGTELIKLIDKVGLLNSLFIALGSYVMIKHKMGPIAFFKELIGLIPKGIKAIQIWIQTMQAKDAAILKGIVTKNTDTAATTANTVANEANAASSIVSGEAEDKNTVDRAENTAATVADTAETNANTGANISNATSDVTKFNEVRKNGKVIGKVKIARDAVGSASSSAAAGAAAEAAGGATGGTATALSGLAAAVPYILAAVAAIAAAVVIFKVATKDIKELSEDLKEAQTEYDNTKTEIETLNDELKTTQEKIAELEAKPSLSFVDQEELAKLKQQNELLERNLKLQKMILAQKEAEVRDKAEEYISASWDSSKWYDKKYTIDDNGVITEDRWYTSGYDTKYVLDSAIQKYTQKKAAKETAENAYANWLEYSDYQKYLATGESNIGVNFKPVSEEEFNRRPDDFYIASQEDMLKRYQQYESDMIEIAEGINLVLNDPQYANLSYGMSDEINAFLDEYNIFSLKWKQAQGEYVKSEAISSMFGKSSTEEMQNLGKELREIADNDSLTDEQKNQQIQDRINGIDKTNEAYSRLNTTMKSVGVTAEDIADYFVLETGEFDSSTIEGVAAQYIQAERVMNALKGMSNNTFTFDGEQYNWEEFFTKDAEGKFKARADKFSEILKGMDNDARENFMNIVETAANSAGDLSKIDWNYAFSQLNFSSLNKTLEVINNEFETINNEMFKGAADDISGLIDTVGELKSALEDVASSMDLVHTAQTQMNNSGRISVKTALELMESTENWDDILTITNGTIKLADNAEQTLIQTKLTAIKTQLQYAWQTAQTKYEVAKASQTELDYADNDNVVMTAESIKAEAIGRVSAVVVALGAAMDKIMNGEWGSAFSAFGDTYKSATATVVADSQRLTSSIDQLKKDAEDKKKMYDAFSNIDDVSSYKNYWDYDKTPGDKYKDDGTSDALEKLQKKYERQLSNLDNQKTYLQNEVDRLETEDKGVSKSYYEKQIAIEQQKMNVYKQERAALKNLLNSTKKGTDQWYEVADAIWSAEHGIQECSTEMANLRKEIVELYQTVFDKMESAFGNMESLFSDRQSYIEKYMELLELQGEAKPASAYTDLIAQEEKKLANYEQELQNLIRIRDEAVASGYVKEGSDEWIEMTNAIREQEAAVLDSRVAIAQYNEDLKQLHVEAFEMVRDAFDARGDYYTAQQDYIEGYIDQLDAMNVDVPEEVYRDLIDIEKKKQENLQANIIDARQGLADLEAAGYTAADEEWQDANNRVIEYEAQMQESITKTIEWNNSIRELDFTKFDRFIEKLEDLNSELDNVYKLTSREDVANEDGTWTEEGLTSLAMLVQQRENAINQAKYYQDEIEKLNEAYARGEMSENTYNERLKELTDGQWDAIQSSEDLKDSIIDMCDARVDLIEDGIQKEIEAYQELIELKKEELQSERD